jgi:hypothetical protein
MHASAWIELVNRIPREDHECLVVGTAAGTEIALQNVLRIEEDYLLIRGRVSGTTDMGRVFILPYDRLTYLHFSRPVPDEKLIQMFGTLLVLEKQAPTATEEEMRETPVDGVEPAAAQEAATGDNNVKSGINLRERLRARLAQMTPTQRSSIR